MIRIEKRRYGKKRYYRIYKSEVLSMRVFQLVLDLDKTRFLHWNIFFKKILHFILVSGNIQRH